MIKVTQPSSDGGVYIFIYNGRPAKAAKVLENNTDGKKD
jgi:hypothetical protein